MDDLIKHLPILPPRASTFADQYDLLFFALTVLATFFTLLVMAMLVVLSLRYRRGARVDRSRPVNHDIRLELTWSVGPLIIGLCMFVWAAWLFPHAYRPPANADELFVIGKQWMWHIQHPNGIRENNELHVPIGRPFKLTMISQDVIHSFFIPAFRVKRDVIPGRYNTAWFEATRPGKYHLFCAEYCGTDHSKMTGWVYVMKPEDYQKWLENGGKSGEDKTATAVLTMESAGKALYEQLACGNCHDADGIQRGPMLAGIYGTQGQLPNGQPATVDTSYIRSWLINPPEKFSEKYQQSMPSYKGQISELQVLQLAAYIKSLKIGSSTVGLSSTPGSPQKRKSAPHATTAKAGSITPAGGL